MSSPTTRTPDQKWIGDGSMLASQRWSGTCELFKDARREARRYVPDTAQIPRPLNIWSKLATPEKSSNHWECKTHGEGKPEGGVSRVGGAFSTWNTVVAAPVQYKQSKPVDTLFCGSISTWNLVFCQSVYRPLCWGVARENRVSEFINL